MTGPTAEPRPPVQMISNVRREPWVLTQNPDWSFFQPSLLRISSPFFGLNSSVLYCARRSLTESMEGRSAGYAGMGSGDGSAAPAQLTSTICCRSIKALRAQRMSLSLNGGCSWLTYNEDGHQSM